MISNKKKREFRTFMERKYVPEEERKNNQHFIRMLDMCLRGLDTFI